MTWEIFLNKFEKRGAGKSSGKKSATKKGKRETLTMHPTRTKNREELVQAEEKKLIF